MARIIGSFDDLSSAVEEATRRRVKDRRGEALKHAQRIKDGARKQADRIQEEILEKAQHQAGEKRRQRLAESEREAKHRRLTAREELLDGVWEEAEGELRDLVNSDGYTQALRQLAWLAVETLGTGHLMLAADPEGHERLTEERLEKWSEEASEDFDASVEFECASDPLDIWGGLIATTRQGRKRMDARFSERLEIAREEMREETFHALMGGS